MKRDMNLVRELLFVAERDEDDATLCDKYGADMVAGHTAILIDAGLINGAVANGSDGRPIASQIIRLTWAGHEFLDNARNDTIWKKAIGIIGEKMLSVSFDTLCEMLKTLVMGNLGLSS